MSKIKMLINAGKDSKEVMADANGKIVVKAVKGAKYQLVDLDKKNGQEVGPQEVRAKRVGKNLVITDVEGRQEIIIEDYYAENAGDNAVIGRAEDGRYFDYIPEDPEAAGLVFNLADGGAAVDLALGAVETSAAGAVVAGGGFPWLLAGLGLLGAGAAYAASRKDGNTTPATVDGGDLNKGSDSGKSDSDNITNKNKDLVIDGKGTPNSTVDVVIKDEAGKTVYEGKATVDANGNYSYTVPATLPDGKYTPYMNGGKGTDFTIDTKTSIEIEGNGKAGTVDPISGTAEAGATVVVKDATGKEIGTTTAGADGKWSVTPTSPVPAGNITAEATDAAGNKATDVEPTNGANIVSTKTALYLEPITANLDNVLSQTEGTPASLTLGGFVQRAIVPATVTLSADALFAFNKSATGDILPAGRAQLDALVAAVRKDNVAVRTVNVIGHADPLGSAAYNEKLAAARAETVRAYLASQLKGVTVTGEGRGEREPVVTTCGNTATKKSIECNAPNRRVVVQLSGTK